ncbi:unnamed protein product [Periconia digitata]|uniref:Uncharacterized protein n=1 Tax=Periconia digitata TaxID=1303443 RepID=A0A9W4UTI3_9PLEO|nr:unnamed protein product [Periconia digitata]
MRAFAYIHIYTWCGAIDARACFGVVAQVMQEGLEREWRGVFVVLRCCQADGPRVGDASRRALPSPLDSSSCILFGVCEIFVGQCMNLCVYACFAIF